MMAFQPSDAFRTGRMASRGILWYLRLGLIGLFFIYLVVHIVIMAIDERDAMIVVKELGREFYAPLQSAQDSAIKMSGDVENNTLFSMIWRYLDFYYNLFKIYLWLWVIMLPINFAMKDANAPLIRWGLAIIFFYTIQILFTGLILKESINTPFIATIDIFKGILVMFKVKLNNSKLPTDIASCQNDSCVI